MSQTTTIRGSLSQRVALVAAIWVAGSLAVAFTTLWWQASQIGGLARIQGGYLVAALLSAVVSFGLRTLRWHLFLAAVGAHPPLLTSLRTQLSGFSLAMTPGKVGEVYKCWLIELRTGIPTARTAPIVFFEKLMDAIAFSALAVLAASLLPDLNDSIELVARSLLMVGAVGIGIAILLRSVRPHDANRLMLRVLGGSRIGRKLTAMTVMALTGGAELLSPFVLGRNMVLSLVARTSDGLTLMWCALALGIDLPALGGIFALNSSGALGGLSMLPGGVGVVEGSMAIILVQLGAGTAAALACTMLARCFSFWMWVAIGLGLLIRSGFVSEAEPAR
jgi:glycosyltransferase 2 family protein